MPPLLQQNTIQYKTYVKETIVQATRAVFATHPDTIVRDNTNVGIDFSFEESKYPSVIVRFYERQIRNAGLAHVEHFPTDDTKTAWIRYEHKLYNGDIEFAIYALSSYDRDIISDALVQMLTMASTEPYTNLFLDRIYNHASVTTETESGAFDPAYDHMINLNTDQISGFGETQTQVPWLSEDQLLYQNSYRIGIFGEFYSRTPVNTTFGLVEKVESYPYDPDAGDTKPDPNPDDPAVWEEYGAGAP